MSTKYRQLSSRSRPACSGIGSWSVGNSSHSFTRKPSSPRDPFKSFDHLLALLQGDIGARTARESLAQGDRKSTRLNSSHRCISYAVFCLKKKKKKTKKKLIRQKTQTQ